MALSGIAAVQARIQAIQEQISTLPAPASGGTGSGAKTGADFASLLTDAMSTQSAISDTGGSAAGGTSSATGGGELSSLLGEAGALTGSGAPGALGASSNTSSALSSLVQSLNGGGTSTTPDMSSLIAGLKAAAGTGATTASVPNATTSQFLDLALAQQGKPYVWGSTASTSDPNPASFDCSELTKWAAARSGVTIPDGAAHQYVWLKEQGATMTVQQALQTPGALLFHFASEPQPGLGGEPSVAHVAISLGNGKTIEAKGHAYGVGVFDAADRFNYAGMIPGMT